MNINISNKNGITLKTANKKCVEDIELTIDESLLNSGESEETGYTLTLKQQTKSGYSNSVADSSYSGVVQYQINEDGVWRDFETIPLTLNNCKSIKFKANSSSQYATIVVGFGNNSIGAQYIFFAWPGQYALSFYPTFKITEDMTMYIGADTVTTGGGAS